MAKGLRKALRCRDRREIRRKSVFSNLENVDVSTADGGGAMPPRGEAKHVDR